MSLISKTFVLDHGKSKRKRIRPQDDLLCVALSLIVFALALFIPTVAVAVFILDLDPMYFVIRRFDSLSSTSVFKTAVLVISSVFIGFGTYEAARVLALSIIIFTLSIRLYKEFTSSIGKLKLLQTFIYFVN